MLRLLLRPLVLFGLSGLRLMGVLRFGRLPRLRLLLDSLRTSGRLGLKRLSVL